MENQPPQNDPVTRPSEDEGYEAASQSTADFIKNVAPLQAQKRKGRKRKVILLIVVVLVVAGAAATYLVLKSNKKQATVQPTPPPTPQAIESTEAVSEQYASSDLRLTLNHPKSWKIDDATSGQLKLESPLAKLTDPMGEPTDGKVVVTILSTGSDPAIFAKNDAVATIDAEKIAYAAPSQNQRKETYLSFPSFGTSSGLDAIFITGDSGYQKGQAVPKTDVVRSDPIISISFLKCTGSTCTDKFSISPDNWGSNKTLETAKAILQSLTIE